jgi:hypothetical protein
MPVEFIEQDGWLHAPRLPLGGLYRGICYAGAEPFQPPKSSQDDLCNCGYARGRCDRLPDGAADAVRFSKLSDAGGRLKLVYIVEKNHVPAESGTIEYPLAETRLEEDPTRLLAVQAQAFVQSYLRFSGSTSRPGPDPQ